MTGGAAHKAARIFNLVATDKLPSHFILIRRWLPLHVEDLFARAYELFRVAVTLKTPLHLKRRDLIGKRHLVNTPVAGRTAYALVHVYAVIEIDELRQVVNARPMQRLARSVTCAHGF